jgi:hypothetical protein
MALGFRVRWWLPQLAQFGAPFYGSLPASHLNVSDIVGVTSTSNGLGYYLVGSNGKVYPFGDATMHGEASSLAHISAPIVGLSVDQNTGGYWEVGSDGGVYAYDAPFDGSAASLSLMKPIVGISSAPDGTGYWLVASDGGVFSYGCTFDGSMGGKPLRAPIVAMS